MSSQVESGNIGEVALAYLDVEVLQELSEVLPPDVLSQRISAFKDELATVGPSLGQLMADRDLDRIAKVAHKFSGAAALFGANLLRDRLSRIEILARRGEAAEVGKIVETIDGVSRATLDAFSQTDAIGA